MLLPSVSSRKRIRIYCSIFLLLAFTKNSVSDIIIMVENSPTLIISSQLKKCNRKGSRMNKICLNHIRIWIKNNAVTPKILSCSRCRFANAAAVILRLKSCTRKKHPISGTFRKKIRFPASDLNAIFAFFQIFAENNRRIEWN